MRPLKIETLRSIIPIQGEPRLNSPELPEMHGAISNPNGPVFATPTLQKSSAYIWPLLATLALMIPDVGTWFIKPRTNDCGPSCTANLVMIDGAKIQWARVNQKGILDVPPASGVAEWMKGGEIPTCPQGGIYELHCVGRVPTCSLTEHHHDLPANMFCTANLRLLACATSSWAEDHHKERSAVPSTADLEPYLANKTIPTCPKGGVYTLSSAESLPTCSRGCHELYSHRLNSIWNLK